ncbi:non-specific lipid-transfer protein A-like [Chenopodium quinoa]|uniref:non-specific lipid-transfer protein A-like n=1 Tax=Chenopodium quinoa TaxID=63459 RepID=UPI000B794693|nr:non-specific lipid-transfer protein A-like [Chenopodium quinoa]
MANKFTFFLGYIAILSLLLARSTVCVPSCVDVVSDSAPCLPFISKSTDSPSDFCCAGIRNVAGMAKSQSDEVQICDCLKANMAEFDYDPTLVADLPKLCLVNITLPPINNTTDCSRVSFGHGIKN